MDTVPKSPRPLYKKAEYAMTKNSCHIIEIIGVTEKGFGVGYVGELVVFVDGGLTGDVVEARLVKVKKSYAYGKIIQIVTPSPHRISSPCAVSSQCGGCQWQHCDYTAQLHFKKQIVTTALSRIGGVDTESFTIHDTIGMKEPFRYRNKAVFPIVPNGDGFAFGMYAPRSHRLIEVSDCLIQHESHIGVLSALREHMQRFKITAYNEAAHRGLMRHVVIRTSFYTQEIMVVLVVNGRDFPHADTFVQALSSHGINNATVLVNSNTTKSNTILSNKLKLISGTGFIREKIGDIEYQLSALSFFQVNSVQARVLYETAIAQAGLTGAETVIDAHCGVGGVALFAAKHAKKVIGVDIVSSAIDDARKNAALNGITNAEFVLGAAEDVIPRMLGTAEELLTPQSVLAPQELIDPLGKGITPPSQTNNLFGGVIPSVIFLDPPRKGCDVVLLQAIIAAGIGRVVYISCDHATLARDIKVLAAGGYGLESVRLVDMFPFTGKVEGVAVLGWGLGSAVCLETIPNRNYPKSMI
ncbi:MAG: 23S rRNA (uracil(1939)-C(5))-methyltransferase RlmD [Defluviitaleaceae bacterium]|nr:23S rRNA (uracil(1939)-C(5))-methyltransferase RlmD [Defluviitaleaceae bacterium]